MSRDSPRVLVGTLAFCGVLAALMQTLMIPLVPSLPRLTHSTASNTSWLITVTLISGCVSNPVFGRMGDLFGKRRMIFVSLSLLIIGSAVCAVTSTIAVLIPGRALQGTALAIVPLAISIMRDELPDARVPAAISLMSATVGIGAAVGYPVASLLVRYVNWHAMFWVAGAVGLLDVVLVALFVRESPLRTGQPFDLPGAFGLTGILISLLLGIEKGDSWGWSSEQTVLCLSVAIVLCVAWGWHELRSRSPLVDLRVSAQRAVLLPNIVALAIGFSFYANSLSTVQLVQEPTSTGYGLGQSALVAGLCVVPAGLAMVVLAPVAARLSRTRGPKLVLCLSSVLLAGGYGIAYFIGKSIVNIVLETAVISGGLATAYSALPLLIMRAVPATETAAANGLNTLMRSVGQSACSAVVASILTTVVIYRDGTAYPSLHAFDLVFVVAGSAALVALVITFFIPGRSADAQLTRRMHEIVAVDTGLVPGAHERATAN